MRSLWRHICSDAYLRTLIRPTVISVFIFLLSVFVGIATAALLPGEVNTVMSSLGEFAQPLAVAPPLVLFLFILLNNGIKLFAAMIAGVFFGVMPAVLLLANGYIIGIVAAHITATRGIEVFFAGILPHGVFEFTALFLTAAAGFRLGAWLLARVQRRAVTPFAGALKQASLFFLQVVTPLVILAAFIETFITPVLIAVLA